MERFEGGFWWLDLDFVNFLRTSDSQKGFDKEVEEEEEDEAEDEEEDEEEIFLAFDLLCLRSREEVLEES